MLNRKRILTTLVALVMTSSLTMIGNTASATTTLNAPGNTFAAPALSSTPKILNSNATGIHDGYNYELWKDYGNTSMTLKAGGSFSCRWSNIGNALFRKGKKFNETQTYKQLGNISVNFNCDYQPSGNSYLCVYGWTSSPLVEYYIVDSWGTWRPPGASPKGTINVDGGTYDIYETLRVNQPSIKGNSTTFKQYWSVRRTKRTSGTISVSKHFDAWESKGMKLGKMYETAFNIEGYQSSGSADVRNMSINIGGR
ncbi:glycoside hydrolase family 11 protein [Clostridium cibarium]|uniref:Endo-1,4-beta-xylanase n=1 Tax=Clostridium cibarium TaxID=2762247 RepID=A0ABR8PQW8_9CLOT|nr:glycoside hydrolase family 11 protein [Clostridium cibarium]MBD7910574.1 glycoside hydrolase family 11 protein [Clostridium cibarium]